jgi:oxygen-dependent protoporphyrinogen oxidase
MILIAGAGISGLSLAFQLKKKGSPFLLLDSAAEAGGKIKTISRNGYVMDTGPNTLLADEGILDFLSDAGLGGQIQLPADIGKNRFIFRDGRFHALAPNPLSLLMSPVISWKGKWRILQERNIQSISPEGESFADFVRRRFGKEALDWLASPVQSGIHAANPEELLVADAFPALLQKEKDFGSLLKALFRSGSAGRASSISFKGGMQDLSRQLAALAGESLQLNTSLKTIRRTETGWNCRLESRGASCELVVDHVVFCLPAPQAALIFRNSGLDSLADSISQIRYQPLAVAHMVFSVSPKKEFRGFGGLVPEAAGFQSAGSIWASSVFPGRAPAGKHLLAGFYGGALRPELPGKTAREIEEILQNENPALYGRKADFFPDVSIWKEAIPSYDRQRKMAVSEIEKYSLSGIHFLSNWKGGIGLADCIRNAGKLAEGLMAF